MKVVMMRYKSIFGEILAQRQSHDWRLSTPAHVRAHGRAGGPRRAAVRPRAAPRPQTAHEGKMRAREVGTSSERHAYQDELDKQI